MNPPQDSKEEAPTEGEIEKVTKLVKELVSSENTVCCKDCVIKAINNLISKTKRDTDERCLEAIKNQIKERQRFSKKDDNGIYRGYDLAMEHILECLEFTKVEYPKE